MESSDQGLLAEAAREIRQLRHHNDILSAKVEVMHMMHDIATARPGRGGIMSGAGEDIAWKIDRRLDEIRAQDKKK